MKITIGHLYPDLLNLYGDRGNIQCLMKRCLWRGIEAETIAYELDDRIDFFCIHPEELSENSDEEFWIREYIDATYPDYVAQGLVPSQTMLQIM